MHAIGVELYWRYEWKAYSNEWYEHPISRYGSILDRTEEGPIRIPGAPGLNQGNECVFLCCPVCHGLVTEYDVACKMCDASFRRCEKCRQLIEDELETCPNCGS